MGLLQAKDARSHIFTADAKLAQASPVTRRARPSRRLARRRRRACRRRTPFRKANERLDEETQTIARRDVAIDAAESVSTVAIIVLCSIALLTGMLMFWWISFAGTAVGVAIAALGFFRG